MKQTNSYLGFKISHIFLRLALAASFLSAVADRLGLWGPPGSAGVVWGDFASFTKYTALLNWFVPEGLVPALAWTATVLEVILGVFLILGFQLKKTALASAVLLILFFLTMTISIGIKAPLDYSVLTAAAAALLLAFTVER